jgi:hypothetical protein
MEVAKTTIHKEGLDGDPMAPIGDADHAHGNNQEKTGPGEHSDADLMSGEARDEEQTKSRGYASADLGSGAVKYGEGLSENAVTSVLDCNGSEGNESKNDGKKQKTEFQDHDDSQAPSAEANDPLHEHYDQPTASLSASEMSQDRSLATTRSSQKQADSTDANAVALATSQKESYSLNSNSRTMTPSRDHPDAEIETSASVHLFQDISNSTVKTGDSTLDLPIGSDSGSTVHDHDSHSHGNTPTLGPSADEAASDAQMDSESDEDAEYLAKIARFELPNGPPPLQLNYEALKHLATYFLPGSHGACMDVTKVWGGSFHEIRILTFEDGWTCIGRFASLYEPLFKTEAELATIAYVRKHAKIPVPEIYFVNHNENHVVGAAFVLMERVPGVRLFDLWRDLSMEHRMSVVTQIAGIVSELADLRFDRIGSLKFDGTVGPLVNISYTQEEALTGPFNNFVDFVCATMDGTRRHSSEEALAIYPAVKDELRKYLASGNLDPMLQAPYRLIHVDLEDRNIMVTRESEQDPPKISGIIDWDHAFVGPSYYLYEHIDVTTELQKEEEELPDLKMLRQQFVKTFVQRHPRNSPERDLIKQCFREKSVELTNLLSFAKFPLDSDSLSSVLETYLASLDPDNECGDHHPYHVIDKAWVPDSDPESDG